MPSLNIFIGLSHNDRKWADRLISHLRVRSKPEVLIWDDRRIRAGDHWEEEVQQALRGANVAVLLISADYLASKFVSNIEVPTLLQRREQEGLRIIPLIVRPCAWHEVPWLRSIQFWPRDAQPLASLSEDQIDKNLEELAEQVAAALEHGPAESTRLRARDAAAEEVVARDDQKLFFITHAHEDGDFAELLQVRIEKEGHQAWVDTERLLVGTDWRREIDQAIMNSAAVLVVMSPEAKVSEYVTYEWAFAWGVGVTVIPLMVKPTPLHPRLETLQFLDFTNRASRPWDKLMRALNSATQRPRGLDAT
jgi:hypothetical protein